MGSSKSKLISEISQNDKINEDLWDRIIEKLTPEIILQIKREEIKEIRENSCEQILELVIPKKNLII